MLSSLLAFFSKILGWLVLGVVLVLFFKAQVHPDTVAFTTTHEEQVPVGKVTIVVQYTSRQVTKDGLLIAGDNELLGLFGQLAQIPGVIYQDSAAQLVPSGANFQYQKTIRIDVTDVTQYETVKRTLDAWPVQIMQTLFTPAESDSITSQFYKNFHAKSRQQGELVAASGGKRLWGVVNVAEATSQLRDNSSNFSTKNAEGILVMPMSRTATFQYTVW